MLTVHGNFSDTVAGQGALKTHLDVICLEIHEGLCTGLTSSRQDLHRYQALSQHNLQPAIKAFFCWQERLRFALGSIRLAGRYVYARNSRGACAYGSSSQVLRCGFVSVFRSALDSASGYFVHFRPGVSPGLNNSVKPGVSPGLNNFGSLQ
jgi:hypothetical protein